jgi:hypothetical protein
MTPTVGRVVLVLGIPAQSNGAMVAPGIITRVWNDTTVNVTVFPDASAPVPATSVKLCASEDEAYAERDKFDYPQTVAYWPPRV